MDKLGIEKESKFTIRFWAPRIAKAAIKTAVIYILYAVFSSLIVPVEGIFDYQGIFTVFFAVYLFFVFVTELTKGTIFHHVFGIVSSLWMVFYFAHILNTGVIDLAVEQMSIMVDLRFFLSIFVLGGILGFGKSMLRLLCWMNEKEEQWLQYQLSSL